MSPVDCYRFPSSNAMAVLTIMLRNNIEIRISASGIEYLINRHRTYGEIRVLVFVLFCNGLYQLDRKNI